MCVIEGTNTTSKLYLFEYSRRVFWGALGAPKKEKGKRRKEEKEKERKKGRKKKESDKKREKGRGKEKVKKGEKRRKITPYPGVGARAKWQS